LIGQPGGRYPGIGVGAGQPSTVGPQLVK
jgi:hypothetical protein